MSLPKDIFQHTRSLMIASASGMILFSQTSTGMAGEPALPEASQQRVRTYQEPALIKIKPGDAHSLFDLENGSILQVQHTVPGQQTQSADQVKRLYGNSAVTQPQSVQPVTAAPVLQTPPSPIQQTAGNRVPRKSLFDRLVGKIRGGSSKNIPAGPPQDPGFNYTTVTEAKLNKTQAPQLVQQPQSVEKKPSFTPPAVPAAIDPGDLPAFGELEIPSLPEPRSFPVMEEPIVAEQPVKVVPVPAPSVDEKAAPGALLPPLPGSDEFATLTPAPVADEFVADAPQSFPELKAIMEGEESEQAAPVPPPIEIAKADSIPETAKKPVKRARPVLDLNGPLPLLEELLEAERAEEASLAESAPEQPEIESVEIPVDSETVAEIPAIDDIDPLVNPFPADEEIVEEEMDLNAQLLSEDPLAPAEVESETVAQAPPMPPVEEPVEEEEPYTGLSLEDDLFLQAKAPEAPEPAPMPVDAEIAEQEQSENTDETLQESVESDAAGYVRLEDTALPELPPFPAPEETVVEGEELELTPSQEIPKLQAPQEETELTLQAPEPQPQIKVQPKAEVKQSKMEMIASRSGQTGLKGFCPVKLRDSRDLVDANDNFAAIYNDKKYSFSDSEALQKFIAQPEMYAPANQGVDIIHYSLTGEELEGTLDYAVWFKGRLYLFSSPETMETFVAAPHSHVTN